MIQVLDLDCDASVERGLYGNGLVVAQVFLVGELDVLVLPGKWLVRPVLVHIVILIIHYFSRLIVPRRNRPGAGRRRTPDIGCGAIWLPPWLEPGVSLAAAGSSSLSVRLIVPFLHIQIV